MGTLGGDQQDIKGTRALNRVVRWTDIEIEMEADPRRTELLIRDLHMSLSEKAVTIPGGEKGSRSRARGGGD